MTLDGQFIFDILLVIAGGAISLFISMLRDEMRDMKQSHGTLVAKVQLHEVEMPKEYVRKEDMNRFMDEIKEKLSSIDTDIKQLVQALPSREH